MNRTNMTKSSSFDPMQELQDLLKEKGIDNIDALQDMIANITKDGIPEDLFDFSKEADKIVEQAWEKPMEEAIKLCRSALELDPNNISAFVLLGDAEDNLSIRAAMFKRGVDIGIDRYDGEFMDEHRGNFWTVEETRPYMLCLAGYAEALSMMGDNHTALIMWNEMLELNPADDQGVRHQAMATMAASGEEELFRKYDEYYSDEDAACMHFNRALLELELNGPGPKADTHIHAGMAANPHMVSALITEELDEEDTDDAEPGSPGEAAAYAEYATGLWFEVDGAMDYLKKFVEG
jgi:tetratricopeptide (TPR) repeat protein